MISRIKKLISFTGLSLTILLSTLVGPMVSLAATNSAGMMDNLKAVGGQSYDSSTDENTLLQTVADLIKVVLSLLGFIFVVLMIYAGILWMTAGGNDTQVKTAKAIVKNAAIGLIIVTTAYAITYFVFANLLDGGGAGPA